MSFEKINRIYFNQNNNNFKNFFNDLELIWENCRIFNIEDSHIFAFSKILEISAKRYIKENHIIKNEIKNKDKEIDNKNIYSDIHLNSYSLNNNIDIEKKEVLNEKEKIDELNLIDEENENKDISFIKNDKNNNNNKRKIKTKFDKVAELEITCFNFNNKPSLLEKKYYINKSSDNNINTNNNTNVETETNSPSDINKSNCKSINKKKNRIKNFSKSKKNKNNIYKIIYIKYLNINIRNK
jgi:hypothetical protein